MELAYCIRELENNAVVVENLVRRMEDEQVRWKPSDLEWSALEVVCHLRDEEHEDFPFRIRHLLSGSAEKWPPILPARWVTDRNYNSEDLHAALDAYLTERRLNLEWLGTLNSPNWDARYAYEPLEGLTAGDLMASWTVHDLLHIRQLNELKYQYDTQRYFPERTVVYAGEW